MYRPVMHLFAPSCLLASPDLPISSQPRKFKTCKNKVLNPNVVKHQSMDLPRGMKDFGPDESAQIESVRSAFARASKQFGFDIVDPSPLELLSVLETKSGPAIRDEIYHFEDKADRNVALRFDFTVGMTRYVTSSQSMRMPAKLAAFGGVWRYDEPQKGRYRFFHQWDIEIYGAPSIRSDIEIVEITARIFDEVGLPGCTIALNHRGLVESYIARIFGDTTPERTADILRAIDKAQKKPEQAILDEFTKKGYPQDKMKQILEFARISGTPEDVQKRLDVSTLESWDYIAEMYDSARSRDIDGIEINFGIVRGLDYYSGMVFEVFDPQYEIGALAGGGRYDTLTQAFGRDDMGAAGVAGGVERMILALDHHDAQKPEPSQSIGVLYVGDEMIRHAESITSKLRRADIPVVMDLAGKSLKKQMDAASDCRFCIIVAPREMQNNAIMLRDMKTRSEQEVPLDDILKDPKSNLTG